MKVILLGRGHRMAEIAQSYARKKITMIAITDQRAIYDGLIRIKRLERYLANPEEVTLAELRITLDTEDIVVVSMFDESSLKRTLGNLYQKQGLTHPVLVYTPPEFHSIEKDFPNAFFHNDSTDYTMSLREITRRTSSRQKMETIRKIVTDAGKAVIIIWGNPDPDALASSVALKYLLRRDVTDLRITYTGEFTRAENLEMVKALGIPTEKFHPGAVDKKTAVITVDAQPSFFQNNGVPKFDIVIDHHPLSSETHAAFSDIRTKYGSTSTIMTEYYRDLGEKMPKKIATALFYGLKTDTNNLQRNISDVDVNAFKYLRKIADENVIRHIELSQMPVDILDHFGIALMKKKVAKPVIFAYLGKIDNPDACVHVADFYLKIEGISWSIVSCLNEEKLIIVFRSDGFRKHAGNLAESLFESLGTAGGHRVMARAEIEVGRLAAEIPDLSDKSVEEWLIQKLSSKLGVMKKLL